MSDLNIELSISKKRKLIIKTGSKWSIDPLKSDMIQKLKSKKKSFIRKIHHALWLVFMPFDWSLCPLIGHHALLLVLIPLDWSSFHLIGHHITHLLMLQAEIPSLSKKCEWQTDMGNPTDAITSKYFIGHHFLLLVKMPSDWYSCSLIVCHFHHVVTNRNSIIK